VLGVLRQHDFFSDVSSFLFVGGYAYIGQLGSKVKAYTRRNQQNRTSGIAEESVEIVARRPTKKRNTYKNTHESLQKYPQQLVLFCSFVH
jgi:hypothetical protein